MGFRDDRATAPRRDERTTASRRDDRTAHVVGAGLAGLAAAVALTRAGRTVIVHEAAGHAGGRCRSFHDEVLDRCIDNGNHLVLSGNVAVRDYLATIGAEDRLAGPERAEFPFFDLATGERWTVRPDPGPVPWWLLRASRRIPGTRLGEYVAAWRLARAGAADTVAGCLPTEGALWRRFWEPLAVSVLNTAADEGSAALLWPVVRETFGRGEAACRPRIAARGLGDCFVAPAVDWLRANGGEVRFHRRLRRLESDDGHVRRLVFTDGEAAEIVAATPLVLAVPPAAAAALIPGLSVPEESRAIVNAHFLVPRACAGAEFLGLVGGVGQWIFLRDDVASVTVSAADDLAAQPNETVAGLLWPEVRRALALPEAPPERWRIVKEKRATIAQTPAQVRRRPPSRTAFRNLALAGDWTATGLPATLEGSVRSGNSAAATALAGATSA